MRLALTTSERQALAATVSIVELDIACGDPAAALQLGRPLALSLRHLGRRETQFELLAMTFIALLISDELPEARATGAELLELALRLDRSKLYTVLDAMAFLACGKSATSRRRGSPAVPMPRTQPRASCAAARHRNACAPR